MKFAYAPLIFFTLSISGCDLQKLQEAQRAVAASSVVAATPTATPSCANFSEYDTYLACQAATYANCNSEWQTFTGGGTALCYYPVPGWANCLPPTVTDWVYTPYTSTVCQIGITAVYWKSRSVIACGSAICACMTAPVTTTTCTGGGCPGPTPSPMPTCVP